MPEFVQMHGEWNLCRTLKSETVLIKNSTWQVRIKLLLFINASFKMFEKRIIHDA